MEKWILLSLLATATYAINNFIDKVVTKRLEKAAIVRRETPVNYIWGMPLYGAVAALVLGSIFWLCVGRPVLGMTDGILVLVSGMFAFGALCLYFQALAKEETSYIVVLFQMIPVLALIASFVFLDERITGVHLLGFILVLAASILMSLRKEDGAFAFKPAFFYVLAADVLWVASYVLVKLTSDAESFIKILSYESWGIFLGGVFYFILFQKARAMFLKSMADVGKGTMAIMFLNEAIYITAKSLTYFAILIGPIALVAAIGTAQVFFAIIYGWVLTMIWPSIFQESIDAKSLWKKFVLTLLLCFGIWLIQ